MKNAIIFTSESVSRGHPDKVCDQVSDAILDACLAQDPNSRVACETLVKDNNLILAGEITTTAKIDYEAIARSVVKDIGYNSDDLGFNSENFAFTNLIGEQSPDIAQGVDDDKGAFEGQGAGDQGIMYGYATDETESLMPLALELSNRILMRLDDFRNGALKAPECVFDPAKVLRPDAKSQVSIAYDAHNGEHAVDTVVLSTQHSPDINLDTLRSFLVNEVIGPVIEAHVLDGHDVKYLINPTGRFEIGGPVGDAGLTGRKIIVDTYGGASRHGGGAFSGKDGSKVDRSAAYAARFVARALVSAGLAKRAEIQLSYAIGYPEPVSINVTTFGTAVTATYVGSNKVDAGGFRISDEILSQFVHKVFAKHLTPAGIQELLDLKHIKYQPLAAYGHFGANAASYPWELEWNHNGAGNLREELVNFLYTIPDLTHVVEGDVIHLDD